MTGEIPDPESVTEAQLADHLEGRPLRYSIDEICSRCDRKNDLRMGYTDIDINDLPDETFEVEEDIRFTVSYRDPPWLEGLQWEVRGLFHERHPQLSREEYATEGSAQAVGSATLACAEDAPIVRTVPQDPSEIYDDDLVLTNVEIQSYSPPSEGEDRTPDEQEETVIAEGIGDLRDWPDEENEWRKTVIKTGEEPAEEVSD